MLDSAIAAGKQDKIDAVAAVARDTYPGSVKEIDAQVASYRKQVEEKRIARLRTQPFFSGWTGQVQLGASLATGNDDSRGGTFGIQISKENLKWKHKFDALADYHRAAGLTDRERFNAAYQGQRTISERFYVYGLLQWERDKPAGYYRRFTEGTGLGVRLIDRPGLRLDIDGGPAFRQTRLTSDGYLNDVANEGEISGRASMALKWDLSPTFSFTQDASAFISDASTFQSTTALTSKLFGRLSARFSFDIKHETDPPIDTVGTDTISRVTLLYSF